MVRDRGRECGVGGLWCRGSRGKVRTGDGKPTDRGDGKEEDLGRKSEVGGLWCRGSRGKVRTWDGKLTDRGRKAHGPGMGRRRTGDGKVRLVACGVAGLGEKRGPGTEMWNWWSVVSQVSGKSEDRGRKCGVGGLWCRRSRGKVRTGDAKPTDLGRKTRGPGTGMWNWWPVVLQIRRSTVAGP